MDLLHCTRLGRGQRRARPARLSHVGEDVAALVIPSHLGVAHLLARDERVGLIAEHVVALEMRDFGVAQRAGGNRCAVAEDVVADDLVVLRLGRLRVSRGLGYDDEYA